MKKLLLTFIPLSLLSFVVHAQTPLIDKEAFTIARAVKLGRGSGTEDFFLSTLNSFSSAELDKSSEKYCDENCRNCNKETGICSFCTSGYYLKDNMCLLCPDNASCSNGEVFVCNNKYYKYENSCISICSNVKCITGTKQ